MSAAHSVKNILRKSDRGLNLSVLLHPKLLYIILYTLGNNYFAQKQNQTKKFTIVWTKTPWCCANIWPLVWIVETCKNLQTVLILLSLRDILLDQAQMKCARLLTTLNIAAKRWNYDFCICNVTLMVQKEVFPQTSTEKETSGNQWYSGRWLVSRAAPS